MLHDGAVAPLQEAVDRVDDAVELVVDVERRQHEVVALLQSSLDRALADPVASVNDDVSRVVLGGDEHLLGRVVVVRALEGDAIGLDQLDAEPVRPQHREVGEAVDLAVLDHLVHLADRHRLVRPDAQPVGERPAVRVVVDRRDDLLGGDAEEVGQDGRGRRLAGPSLDVADHAGRVALLVRALDLVDEQLLVLVEVGLGLLSEQSGSLGLGRCLGGSGVIPRLRLGCRLSGGSLGSALIELLVGRRDLEAEDVVEPPREADRGGCGGLGRLVGIGRVAVLRGAGRVRRLAGLATLLGVRELRSRVGAGALHRFLCHLTPLVLGRHATVVTREWISEKAI